MIEPSVQEINAKTDILVTYEFTGRGKKAKVVFEISGKTPLALTDEDFEQTTIDDFIDETDEESFADAREKICPGFEDETFAEFSLAQLEELKSLAWHNVDEAVVERHKDVLGMLGAHQQAVIEYIHQKILLCNARGKQVANRYGFIKKAVAENYQ